MASYDHPQNSSYDYKDAVIIAHSQGTLVSRVNEKRLRQDNDLGALRCGGMAFFGGPHLGSPALKDFAATGKKFTTKMAIDLSQGPLKTEIINNRKWLVRKIAEWIKVDDWYEGVVEAFVSPLTNVIFDQNISELASEMATGSPQLNNLNDPTSPPSVPMVAFYGDLKDVEKNVSVDPNVVDIREIQVIWAIMQWMLESPNSGGFFHAQKDWELQLQMSDWQMEYFDKMQHERAIQELTFNNTNCWWWSQSKKQNYLNSTGVNPWTYCKYKVQLS